MRIEIEKRSGCCFGVQNALELAEELLAEKQELFCLGEIVHNRMELNRLALKGLVTIGYERYKKLKNKTVLIRAHGEPPETYKIAHKNQLTIIDATCPVVMKLQTRIKEAMDEARKENGYVLLFGKKDHPEVKALVGQTNGDAIVFQKTEELADLDFTRPVCLFSQTTMDTEKYNDVCRQIGIIMNKGRKNGKPRFHCFRTVCNIIAQREPGIRNFASRHDVVIMVSDPNSSNGKMLFDQCREVNKNAYFVTGPKQLKKHWFANASSAGICGATSTPDWLLKEVAGAIGEMTRN